MTCLLAYGLMFGRAVHMSHSSEPEVLELARKELSLQARLSCWHASTNPWHSDIIGTLICWNTGSAGTVIKLAR